MEDFELTLFDRMNVIKDTITKYGEENFYVSFSGGKDSTVLHYMLDLALPENKIPRVYVNTGIEYNDVVRFVKDLQKIDDRIVIIRNTRNIRTTLDKKGYPFKSKDHSKKVDAYQRFGMIPWVERYVNGLTSSNEESKFKCPEILKYQFTQNWGGMGT